MAYRLTCPQSSILLGNAEREERWEGRKRSARGDGKEERERKKLSFSLLLDCSLSPYFFVGFSRLTPSMQPPPSWFVKASAIWGECLNY